MLNHGRALSDFKKLSSAEQTLLKQCLEGDWATLSETTPQQRTSENEVRATFIRFLLLSDQVQVHESGMSLRGAWITGQLNLSCSVINRPIELLNCHFEQAIALWDATATAPLRFCDSTLQGFNADRLKLDSRLDLSNVQCLGVVDLSDAYVRGQVIFNEAKLTGIDDEVFNGAGLTCDSDVLFRHTRFSGGMVDLMTAQIAGELGMVGANLDGGGGIAFCADRMVVKGSIYLGEGFKSRGQVRLSGATVGGQISCSAGHFDAGEINGVALNVQSTEVRSSVFLRNGFSSNGTVVLTNATIGGDLSLIEASSISALHAMQMSLKGQLNLLRLGTPLSNVSLAGARIERLTDDASSWGENIVLNGCVYQFIDVPSQSDFERRLNWLRNQKSSLKPNATHDHFRPQPWRQLKTVLENMGHAEQAREVGIAYEECRYTSDLIGQGPSTWRPWERRLNRRIMRALHWLYGVLTGYGYRPMLLAKWFFIVWAICTGFYWWGANQGAAFAPTDPLIFQNPSYASCMPSAPESARVSAGTGNWYLCNALPQEYTGFSPMAFSLDLLLPLVDLHQENDWAPLIETPKANPWTEFWGVFSVKRGLRVLMWFEILAGWGFSLLFVAVISGLTRRQE